ncbi:MAG: hypothetical protein K2G87_05900, partial [Oscillospiraceae bacterium]|nr:hypothetical protein [Oscillospiraceae bacterium]
MNVRKYIAALMCAAILPCCLSGCTGNSGTDTAADETEENTMQTSVKAADTEDIPFANVDTSYKSVTIDGNTINMDDGTVYRGIGVVTGNNSSRLLMDYKV